jgi:Polyketide cyclase / dehydrase and lipid transport
MASIRKDIVVGAPAQLAWEALRDFGAVHQRVAPGFVVDAALDGRDRVVTFASGAQARERLVAVDDERRRLVYTVVEGPLGAVHHHAVLVHEGPVADLDQAYGSLGTIVAERGIGGPDPSASTTWRPGARRSAGR